MMITYFLLVPVYCSERDLLYEVYLWHFVVMMLQDYGLHKFYADELKLPLLAVDYDLLYEICLEHFVASMLQNHGLHKLYADVLRFPLIAVKYVLLFASFVGHFVLLYLWKAWCFTKEMNSSHCQNKTGFVLIQAR